MSKPESIHVDIQPCTEQNSPNVTDKQDVDKKQLLGESGGKGNLSRGQICCVVVLILSVIIYLPFYLLFSIARRFFCGSPAKHDSNGDEHDSNGDDSLFCCFPTQSHSNNGKELPIVKVLKKKNVEKVADEVAKSIRSRVVVFILIWVTLNLTIPGLKAKMVLGSELWKWTLLLAMILCGYNMSSLVTRFSLRLLRVSGLLNSSKKARYLAQGLRVSVNLVVHAWALLLTWVVYFRTSDGLKTTSPDKHWVIHVGTWTFATLAVGAALWLLKNAMVLVWKANAVYTRFRGRIFSAGFQLYYLGHICVTGNDKERKLQELKIFKPTKPQVQEQQQQQHTPNLQVTCGDKAEDAESREEEKRKARSSRPTERGKFYEGKGICEIMQMADYFIQLSRASSRDDDGTSDVLDHCKSIACDSSMEITVEKLQTFQLEKDDAELLLTDIKMEHLLPDSQNISYENFEKFMVRAHKNCLALGHTLVDAIEVVKVLNNVLTIVLSALAVIAWLLLTDIATNKLLVLIASPFLAATFVFGDTCKKAFEGVIFSFVSHPFDVGDLCIIDGSELEVKLMGILTTSFINIATKQEVLLPNSALATQSITIVKGEPDPSDCVELKLEGSSKKNILVLKDKITKFFEEHSGVEKATSMTVEEIGSCIRLKIYYHIVMSIHDVTHSQCLEKKKRQRSELLLEIAQYTDEN